MISSTQCGGGSSRHGGARHKLPAPVLSVLLVAFCTGSMAGEVRVSDEWGAKGELSLDNGEVRVEFTKRSGLIRVLSSRKGEQLMTVLPLGRGGKPAAGISSLKVTAGSTEKAECVVEFAGARGAFAGRFGLNGRGAISVKSKDRLDAVRVAASMRYGVLPCRLVDDNIYEGKDYPELDRLHIPPEYMFMGLVRGNKHVVVGAWPLANDRTLTLLLDKQPGGDRGLEAFEVTLAGTEVWLGVLSAEGIWHQLGPEPSWKGRDVTLDWKPPFDATWKGQVDEKGTPTTYLLRRGVGKRIWRPVVGNYTRPFFFDHGKVVVHFSKVVPPKGKVLLYALEGSAKTPYAFLTSNLPRKELQAISDLDRTFRPYDLNISPKEPVMGNFCRGRAEVKETCFFVGAQAREKDFLKTYIDDKSYPVKGAEMQNQRLEKFFKGLDELADEWIRKCRGKAETVAFLERTKKLVASAREVYRSKMQGHSPEDYLALIDDWSARVVNLAEDPTAEACPELLHFLTRINDTLNRQEGITYAIGNQIRRIFQSMAYECVSDAKLVPCADAFRSLIRRHMKYAQHERTFSLWSAELKSLLPGE